MGDTISKVNQINFLATKVSQDQNTLSLNDKNNQDLRNRNLNGENEPLLNKNINTDEVINLEGLEENINRSVSNL